MPVFEHGGSSIYYEEYGSGDPVLLMPGFAGTGDDHVELREALLSAGYRVISADLPGSGKSGPQPRQYPPTFYQDDAASMAALLVHLRSEPAHLVGHSDGGEVSLLMAALTPEVARSVVAWGAAGALGADAAPMLEMFRNLIDDPAEPVQGFSVYLKEQYGEDNARAMTRSFADASGAIIAAGGDISASKVGAIECPVLLVTGEHDMLVPHTLVAELASHIKAEVEVIEIEGAGHGDMPAATIQAITDWLRKH